MRFSTLLISLLLLLFTSACSNKKYLSSARSQNVIINDSISNDAKIDSIINPYKVKMEKIIAEKLIISERDLVFKKTGGSLGNYVADVLLESSRKVSSKNIDFMFLNSNSIQLHELKKGIISTGQMYEMLPNNYTLVLCQIKGKELKKLFSKIVETENGIISLTASIYNNKSTGYSSFAVNSVPIRDEQIYSMLTTDFVFYGGEGYQLDFEGSEILDIKMRDAVIEYFKDQYINNKTIDKQMYERINIQ